MLFSKAIELFLENTKEKGFTADTIKNYKGFLIRINEYICTKLNRPPYFDEVTAEFINKFLSEEMSEEKYSSSARRCVSTTMKSFYKFCYNNGFSKENFGTLIKN